MNAPTVLSQMKIAVVDNHDLIREGLNAVLVRNGAGCVGNFSNAMDLVSSLDSGESYDFYVIDLDANDIDGFVLIEIIRARNRQARIIASTMHAEVWTLRKLLTRDVNAIIYKSGEANEVIKAINEIVKDNRYYSDVVARSLKIASDNTLHPTARELEVLNQIARGKTSREIAAAMFVTDNTIEAHRKALFAKLGAVNVADLIVKAFDKGYLKLHHTQH